MTDDATTPPVAGEAEEITSFLEEAARYFEKRPTGGEDAAHWANVSNAEKCREAAALIRSQAAERARLLMLRKANNDLAKLNKARAGAAVAKCAELGPQAETYRQMHDTAEELGLSDILDAMEWLIDEHYRLKEALVGVAKALPTQPGSGEDA